MNLEDEVGHPGRLERVAERLLRSQAVSNAVHRIIEQRAATRPETVAILEGPRGTTYREVNQRANALARRLCESGLSRGSLALVRMPRSTDLAVILLAVLKAGACYTWIEPGSSDDLDLPSSFCILRGQCAKEEQFIALDVERALCESASRLGPNLPVLTRGSDVACVLPDGNGRPHVLVPHATIAALPESPSPRRAWEGAAGALDLWAGLMSGVTLSLGATPPVTAAA